MYVVPRTFMCEYNVIKLKYVHEYISVLHVLVYNTGPFQISTNGGRGKKGHKKIFCKTIINLLIYRSNNY